MEKLDWSKLGEMPAYAPTEPGKYLMRCGGVDMSRIIKEACGL